jgi:drug/metabolite transporter (DMT)-like permease
MGERVRTEILAPALLVGAVCYGASILLDAYALRRLGAAREAVFLATAPFIGAVAAIPLLGERLGFAHLLSAVLMVVGVSSSSY